MIASFFQSLEREAVAYLLVSGQATVLYGAAAFSEDVELWMTNRMLAARRADRDYWSDIIGELRELRDAGRLMPVGQPVVPPA